MSRVAIISDKVYLDGRPVRDVIDVDRWIDEDGGPLVTIRLYDAPATTDDGDRPAARRSDPDTSHEAARSITAESLSRSQHAVLAALRYGPATDRELVHRYAQMHKQHPRLYPEQSESGIRTRRGELARKGAVAPDGRRRLPSRRWALVWKATT